MALYRLHTQNLCKTGKPDSPDTKDARKALPQQRLLGALPRSAASSLVLQQELQLLQGQPHSQLLLSHQIQDLL